MKTIFFLMLFSSGLCFADTINLTITPNADGSIDVVNSDDGTGYHFNNQDEYDAWISPEVSFSKDDQVRAVLKDLAVSQPVITDPVEVSGDVQSSVPVSNSVSVTQKAAP